MKICVIGAGVVGSYLASRFAKDGYEVAVVDFDKLKVESLTGRLDILGIECNALELKCLEQVKDFEIFIVVTDKEEINLAISAILRGLLKKDKVLIRVNSNVLAAPPIRELLGIEAVNTTAEIISNITDIINFPFALSVARFEKGKLFLIKYQIKTDDIFSGRQLSEFKALREKIPFTIAAVEREGKVIIPKGKTILYPQDKIYIAVRERDVKGLFEELFIKFTPVNNIFILGYSSLVVELLKRISDMEGLKIKFVDPDISNCEEIAGHFPDVSVLHSEVTNVNLLKAEGIEDADITISITDDEENNILSCILSKRLGAKKVVALVAHPEYESIIESIGIDSPIVPRKLIASKVYRNLSHRGLVEMFELQENIEVFEKELGEEFDGKLLSDIPQKECPLVLGVKREDEIEIAIGNTMLRKGDVIICIREIR